MQMQLYLLQGRPSTEVTVQQRCVCRRLLCKPRAQRSRSCRQLFQRPAEELRPDRRWQELKHVRMSADPASGLRPPPVYDTSAGEQHIHIVMQQLHVEGLPRLGAMERDHLLEQGYGQGLN